MEWLSIEYDGGVIRLFSKCPFGERVREVLGGGGCDILRGGDKFPRRFGSCDDEAICGLGEFDVLMEQDELLTKEMQVPEPDWVNKSDKFLTNDVNGDELGLDDDDEVPLMEGVSIGAFGAWEDGISWVRLIRLLCGGVRLSLGLLFGRDGDAEGDFIEEYKDVGDED